MRLMIAIIVCSLMFGATQPKEPEPVPPIVTVESLTALWDAVYKHPDSPTAMGIECEGTDDPWFWGWDGFWVCMLLTNPPNCERAMTCCQGLCLTIIAGPHCGWDINDYLLCLEGCDAGRDYCNQVPG